MTNPSLRSARVALLLGSVAAVVLATSGCGTRVSDARVKAANAAVVSLAGNTSLGTAGTSGPTTTDPTGGAAVDPGTGASAPVTSGTTGGGSTDTSTTGGAADPGSTGASTTTGSSGTAPVTGGTASTTPATGTKGTTGTTGTTGTKSGTKAGASAAPVAANAPCTSQGAPVVIGQTGVFSGFIGAVGAGARPGLQVWAKDLNSRGGLACHPVQVVQEDDASDPAKVTANVKDLVENKHANVLLDAYEPITIGAYRSAAAPYKIPTIGGDNVELDWNQDPLLFPLGGSPLATYLGSIKSAADATGFKKFGILYCVEATICGVLHQSATSSGGLADQAGVTTVYSQAFSLTQPDFTSECQNMKNAGVQFVFVGGDGSAVSRIARACKSLSYTPAMCTISLAAGSAVLNDAQVTSNGLYLGTNLASFPATDSPGVQAYHAAFQKYAPTLTLDGATMIAWASGKMLEAAVSHIPNARSAPLTSALILQGLGKVSKETLNGLEPPVTFTPGEANAPLVNCYDVVSLTTKAKGFTAPQGSTFTCP